MARSALGGVAEFRKWAASHCDVARLLGARMGLTEQVQEALRHLYERWDGKGMPGELRGDADPAGGAADAGGPGRGHGLAARRRGAGRPACWPSRAGSGLDPQAVRQRSCRWASTVVCRAWTAPSIWDDALRAEPGPQPVVSEDRLDACLSAVADFADLKSMWTHRALPRGGRGLPAQAAAVLGLPAADVQLLRRAALVHDIGRVAVPVRIWAKPGPLRPRRARAGAAARVSHRAGARRGARAAAAGPAGRVARRALRRVRLSPRQPGRRPAADRPGCWPRRTAITRCASHGRTGRA